MSVSFKKKCLVYSTINKRILDTCRCVRRPSELLVFGMWLSLVEHISIYVEDVV